MTKKAVSQQSVVTMCVLPQLCVVASDGLCYVENAIVTNPPLVCVPCSCPKGHPVDHLQSL